ncbi:MAG TPA: bifunctional diguanylate cyclase/phosphodiesterase [Acidimicrobiales bacterium]|nr:bifunctional diguanylate cyclase/phosphodiesterase [Acidimicrobiales bacterium]
MARRRPTSLRRARALVGYGVLTLVPVLLLGFVLVASFRSEAAGRGVAEGRSEAVLVARTAVEPVLDGRPLADGLSSAERRSLGRIEHSVVAEHGILRLRVRDLSGNVVFSKDGSGAKRVPEREALVAARGRTVALLTHLNADANDTGSVGPASVEVYLPLLAGTPSRRVGVLELYLPYAPIAADVSAGLHDLYRDLGIGLGVLYVVLLALALSVSRRLRQQVRLNGFLADHDPLTGLANRPLFHRRARGVVASAKRRGTSAVIALLDLDRFKEINDTLGHHNGDVVLVELAARLLRHTARSDVVARLGGDEFALVLRDVADVDRALAGLRTVIEEEVEVGGIRLSVAASIGYVVAPEDGADLAELVRHAEVAMYQAQEHHAGTLRYDPAADHFDAANLHLVSELRYAIEGGELVLHYQPQTRLADGRVRAVEALVRWKHPVRGLLYPDSFVPLAEQTGLIERLTEWVLERALTDLRELGPIAAGVSVAVNASARNLGRADFARRVALVLERVGVPASQLTIEITETALLADTDRAAEVLGELDALGVRVSLDDFGKGQTALGYLSALPLRELKIDRGFVTDAHRDASHRAIVRSVIELGHNLGFSVVGEGVETEESLAVLRHAGCDLAQGFLFALPMPADSLRAWLATRAGRALLAVAERD